MKDKLFIYIPTYRRIDKQVTLKNIPKDLLKVTRLVVDFDEGKDHIKKYGKDLVLVCDKKIKGLSAKRQWIMENSLSDYSMMLDDDLSFNVRVGDGVKTAKCSDKDFINMYNLLHSWLLKDGFVHVGISHRAGNNHIVEDYAEITRMCTAYAYDVKKFLDTGIDYGRLRLMQDFDVTLSLIELGYKNRVTYRYMYSQVGSGTEGGCSEYRTGEMMRDVSNELARLHPGVVDVVIKESKQEWIGVGNKRYDVNIQWKKAFGRKKHGEGISKFF